MVGRALGPDMMKTVVHLLPDILSRLPLLIYEGRLHPSRWTPGPAQRWVPCRTCCLTA